MGGCSGKGMGYLVPVVLVLECLKVDLVLLALLVLQLECLGVDLVPLVLQLVSLLVDLGDDVGSLLLNLLESELISTTPLPNFFCALVPLPVPLPLPFTCVFCTDCALGLTVLDATGIHVGKCTDVNIILGLPALDVDAMGPSAIRHHTICQKISLPLLKFKKLEH